jgi:hypothetical protein
MGGNDESHAEEAVNLARVALSLPMQDNDAGAPTVRAYLLALLRDVWTAGENFDGKRPFGNSGWEGELYETLIGAGLVDDEDAAFRLIHEAIQELK